MSDTQRRPSGREGEDVLRRLCKIEGQVRGLATMVEGGRATVDILTQVAAARAALSAAGVALIEAEMHSALARGVSPATIAQDAVIAVDRLLRHHTTARAEPPASPPRSGAGTSRSV